jgi:lysophospholipase L1-like esterase
MILFWIGIGILILIVLVGVLIYKYLYALVLKKPANTPKDFLKIQNKNINPNKSRKVFVLAGDSLTCGNMGSSYVDILEKNLPNNTFELINAGINADLSYTLLSRIEEIIACQPDFITILIGTNDCNATLGKNLLENYIQLKKIQKDTIPNVSDYEKNLSKIVERLKKETNAQIALISMPVLAENLEGNTFEEIQKYVESIKKVAEMQEIDYLPFFEQHQQYLRQQFAQRHKTPRKYNIHHKFIEISMFRHYILGHSWDKITDSHGFVSTPDFLHLNSKAAEMLASLINDWIGIKTDLMIKN